MAKKVYIGIGGVARESKKLYIGINNIARKIKKAYIGIGNIARLFYNAVRKIAYDNTLQIANNVYYNGSAAHNNTYAIFAGGEGSSGRSVNVFSAIDKTLTTNTGVTSFYNKRRGMASASLNDYAMFFGGTLDSYDTWYRTSVYNSSLTHQEVARSSAVDYAGVDGAAGCVLNNRALFAGGYNGNADDASDRYLYGAFTIDNTLTTANLESLTKCDNTERYAAITDNHALVITSGIHNTICIDIYDKSFTHTTISAPFSKVWHPGASVGGNAIFPTYVSTNDSAPIYRFNDSLTASIISSTETSLREGISESVDDHAIFGLGYFTTTIYEINSSFTVTKYTVADYARWNGAATSIGDYILINGGYNSDSSLSSSRKYYSNILYKFKLTD